MLGVSIVLDSHMELILWIGCIVLIAICALPIQAIDFDVVYTEASSVKQDRPLGICTQGVVGDRMGERRSL
jgi:hypothetical protein